MYQNTIIKSEQKQIISLNYQNVNQLFPGFTLGDFALLYGSQSVSSISALLCIKAQLPIQLGGIRSNVIFIDGGNCFKLHQISRFARLHYFNPKKILKKIHITRAFTAYQITSLILEQLKGMVNRYKAKVVIISDILSKSSNNKIDDEEINVIYNQVIRYLKRFAKKNNILVIITENGEPKNKKLHELICKKA